MTKDDRIRALQKLGYSLTEAGFLCLVALHGGYFVRRQFCKFAKGNSQWPVTDLEYKILPKGHAGAFWSRGTLLYRLHSRRLYAAIGERGPHRSRGCHRRISVRPKLMQLDYVLANPGKYLETETEKLDFFHRERGIGMDFFPSKNNCLRNGLKVLKYFPDDFPISISDKPVFVYIDGWEKARPSFETYLHRYAGLFSELKHFRVVFVTIKNRRLLEAEAAFGRAFGHSTDRLLNWLRLETHLRAEQYRALDLAKLDELRTLRNEFRYVDYERLMSISRQGGDEAVIRENPFPAPEFVPCRLADKYQFLGIKV
jgi:hypothetical protein